MDELELLKKQWQSQEQELPQLSYSDIYKMLLKKSSSIMKWIFIISIAEILFWTLLAFFVPESSKKINDGIGLHNSFLIINIINYAIFGGFIFLFYKNYRKIKVTDSIKELMKNILNARKTVKYFVYYNIAAAALMIIGVNLYYYTHQEVLFQVMAENYPSFSSISSEKFANAFFMMQFIFGIILIGLMLLFYRVVYGILLRRLKKNYKELKKIEF